MGEEHDVLTGDLGMLGSCVGDLLLELGDEFFALVFLADRLAVQLDRLAPRCAPGGHRVCDHGSDLAEGVVVLLRQTRVAGEDDVGLGVGDSFEVDAVGLVEQHRCGRLEFLELLLHPREHAITVVITEVGRRHTNRHHSEGQRHLVVGPVHRRDAFGLFVDRRGPEGVLDGDRRPVAVPRPVLVGRRRARCEPGGQKRGRSQCDQS